MNEEEAIDILANCIDDYVIGDFCVGKFCPMENECKDKECVFHLAIETVLNLIKKQQAEIEKKDKIIDEMAEYLSIIRDCPNEDCGANLDCENRCSNDDSIYAECWKMYFERKIKQ